MKTLSATIACLVATFAIAALAQADEGRHIKLVLQTNPEAGLVTIETDDLALGESRTFTSENGHPVILTRTGQGFEIDVDGKKTSVELPKPEGEGFEFETREEGHAGDGERRVIVKRLGGDAKMEMHGADGARIEIHGGEPGEGGQAVHKEVRVIRLGGEENGEAEGAKKRIQVMIHGDDDLAAARAKLIASGALDGLDEATREKILAALGGKD